MRVRQADWTHTWLSGVGLENMLEHLRSCQVYNLTQRTSVGAAIHMGFDFTLRNYSCLYLLLLYFLALLTLLRVVICLGKLDNLIARGEYLGLGHVEGELRAADLLG